MKTLTVFTEKEIFYEISDTFYKKGTVFVKLWIY